MKGNFVLVWLILFVNLFLNSESFSQTYKISTGIAISPSIATAYKPEASVQELPRASIGAGIDAKFKFSKNYFLVSGLFYLDRGFMIEDFLIDSVGNYLGTYRLSEHQYYLSVPIVILYQPNHFFLGAGPNFNFYLDRKKHVEGVSEKVDILFNDKYFLFGSQFQLGYETSIRNNICCYVATSVNATFDFNLVNYGLDIGIRYVLSPSVDSRITDR